MHVRLFGGQLKPGAREEAIQRFQEEVLPLLRERDNYARCQVLANPDEEFIAALGFASDCGPGLLRQLYEEMYGKMADLLEDENLDHSLWEEVIVDERAAAPDN